MNHRLTFGFHWPAKALAFALALHLASLSAPGQTLPIALKIVVVQGEGATGSVRQQPSQVPVVRVVDEKESPVAGAAVVFTLPTEGATGEFPNGGKTLMVITDAEGTATAKGLRFNQLPGKVPININVSFKGLTARTTLTQLSVAPAGYKPGGGGGHAGKWIAIVAVVAAGGAAGAFLGLRNNNSTSSTPTTPTGPQPIGITAGTPSLAPPR